MNSNTVWPETTPVSDPTKKVMRLLLNLLDKSDNAGDRLADEVFTSDGYLGAAAKTAKGSAEIRQARKTAWVKVDYRHHVIDRVYANSDRDFLFIGSAKLRTKTGKSFGEEFLGRMIIDDPKSAEPRVEYFTVWVDTLALHNVMHADN